MCGTDIVVETPGPIPNPAVKHDGADGRIKLRVGKYHANQKKASLIL